MIKFFKKVLAFLIVLLAVAMLSPLWPSQHYRQLSLVISIRPLLLLGIAYGALAFAEFIHDCWERGLL